MSPTAARWAGWLLIAALCALSVVLDRTRMLTAHFNWFMAIQVSAVAAVVLIVIRMARHSLAAGPTDTSSKKTPAETGGEQP